MSWSVGKIFKLTLSSPARPGEWKYFVNFAWKTTHVYRMSEPFPETFSGVGDINDHTSKLSERIRELKEPHFYESFLLSQILIAEGNYVAALPLLDEAMAGVRKVKDQFEWARVYLAIGGTLSQTLDSLNLLERADSIYAEMLLACPTGMFIGEYAIFLQRKMRDFDRAQAFFKKSLHLYPFQSSIHLKYAGFLRHVRKDADAAERHYKLAVDTNPSSAEALGSYASFLHGVRGNISEAEGLYQRSVEADPTHTNNLCNYGLFLSEGLIAEGVTISHLTVIP